jgi:di- and tripeptidase
MDLESTSASASDIDEGRTWGEDARSPVTQTIDDASSAQPSSDCGIGHRVLASRSVLALVVDEHCVFAGLQGGDIVVSYYVLMTICVFINCISGICNLTVLTGVVP